MKDDIAQYQQTRRLKNKLVLGNDYAGLQLTTSDTGNFFGQVMTAS